jgi:hypothetical protein
MICNDYGVQKTDETGRLFFLLFLVPKHLHQTRKRARLQVIEQGVGRIDDLAGHRTGNPRPRKQVRFSRCLQGFLLMSSR